jgi:hypothetical protein
MNINVTIEQADNKVSVIADSNRIIADVINELNTQGYLSREASALARSYVQERVISTDNTFQEEEIFSGDKIVEI